MRRTRVRPRAPCTGRPRVPCWDVDASQAMNDSLISERKLVSVLLVDDMPEVLHDLRQLLELTGVIAIAGEARNGTQAVQLAVELVPDAVVMDLEMPGTDGFEATRRIKAHAPTVRVIILSVHAGREEQERAREAGADAFVLKGASYEVLMNAILQMGTTAGLASAGKEGEDE